LAGKVELCAENLLLERSSRGSIHRSKPISPMPERLRVR